MVFSSVNALGSKFNAELLPAVADTELVDVPPPPPELLHALMMGIPNTAPAVTPIKDRRLIVSPSRRTWFIQG